MFDLAKALHQGYLNGVMNENKRIDIDILREAVERFADKKEVLLHEDYES